MPSIGEGDHRFPFAHFFLDIIGASFCNSGSAGFGGGFHFITDDLRKVLMRGICDLYLELLFLFH